MSGPYRFVEHPAGVWRIEQKGWFSWATVGITEQYGTPFRSLVMGSHPKARWVFASLAEAEQALSAGLAKQAVRNIVPFETGNRVDECAT